MPAKYASKRMWSSNYFLYPLHNKIFIISLSNCKGCLSSLYCKYWYLKLNCYPCKKLFLLFFNKICMITFCLWAYISIIPPHRILLKSTIFLFPIIFLCNLHRLRHLCVCVHTEITFILKFSVTVVKIVKGLRFTLLAS